MFLSLTNDIKYFPEVSWAATTATYWHSQNSALAADSYNSISRNVYLGCEVALFAERVLVDVNDEFVLQQLLGAWTDVPQVIGHEQRSSHDGPQRHLRLLLGMTQTKVPNHELEKEASVK